MVERKEYLEKLKKWKDKDLIKVVTGIRRCGKSTLFELYIDYLKSIGIEDNHIISINLEDPDNEFDSYKDLYKYFKEFNDYIDLCITKKGIYILDAIAKSKLTLYCNR